ncbi:TonB-dependent receptor domain-containing protein [Pedomonas mirosovicensis]|uniref:TonB-dependent receptor domain-containing protein n=1 Tax=Pedomonas mirosovicensis TaxID=2908641 RepID=UPI002169BED6|nr:TonB-dependent receptor [Pedomonas mirosovicensis]MCH8686517.1 TonB-dependent receptor [Pedomonas mirosovicensis]
MAVLAPAILPSTATAQTASDSVQFDIPSQPLADALNQYARQADRQILLPYEAAAALRSPKVRGRMTRQEALERLLAGSSLEIADMTPQAITIRRPRIETANADRASPGESPSPEKGRQIRKPNRLSGQRRCLAYSEREKMKSTTKVLLCSSMLAGGLTQAPGVLAQDVANEAGVSSLDEIIVTGRAGTGVRTKAETSYSVTNIDEATLRLQAPTSVTEALKSVPGFWVEASGGEASGNVRARGVPVDGFGSVQLLEDGIPIQHDPALGYLNGDQVFRLDETIDRIEVVRGGPSSVFYANAPAGAINFIPRKVGDEAEGLVKATVGDHDHYRLDFWTGAPIGEWKLAIGGFYRSYDGARDVGFTGNKGGQIRASLSREFERGSIELDIKRVDDTVAFYTGIPMRTDADGKIRAVPGFDGHHGSVAGPETSLINMIMGDGSIYEFDNTRGTEIKRTQVTGRFTFEPADGWKIVNTSRFNDTTTQRNGVYPNTLLSATSFLEQQAGLLGSVPGATGLQLRYVNEPGGIYNTANQNGNGLVMVGGLRGITMPVKEFISDTQVSHRIELGSSTHDITFGYYFAHIQEDFSRYSSSVLLDVQTNARLLDLVAVDAAGNVVSSLTDNGIWRYGYEWENASGEQTTHAFYLADEWQVTDALRIDGGLRWEKMTARGRVETKQTVNLGSLPTSQIQTGTGVFGHYDDSFDKLGWTVGVNYQFDDRMGMFARYTAASRMPSLGNYITNAAAKPDTQTMDLGEVGFKFSSPLVDVYATGFWTKYNNVGFSNYRFDLETGASVSEARYADTQTFGLELETVIRPTTWFDLAGTVTFQEPKYKGLTYTDASGKLNDYDGNQLIRVPKFSLRVVPGVNLFNGALRLQAAIEHQGKRYVDTANSVRLPSYEAVNLSGRWQINEQLSFYGYIDNLTNSLGLTEGNPRAGELQNADAGANTFIARPLIGRTYRAALMYRF